MAGSREGALKAWRTMRRQRKQQEKKWSIAAHKAWATRRKNALA